MNGSGTTLSIATRMAAIDAGEWDALAGADNPFTSHAFLAAMEAGGAVGSNESDAPDAPDAPNDDDKQDGYNNNGWEPMHLLLRDANGQLLAAMPHYLKHHSYGEYIFDHGWANGFNQAGGSYYPKLLGAVPFTPATGPRLLAKDNRDDLKLALAHGMAALADQYQLSSAHINFLTETDARMLSQGDAPALNEQDVNRGRWLLRTGLQFHWHNQGFASFDDFLHSLSSRKRKNIRKERASVTAAGVTMLRLTGDAITPAHIDDFYRFYMSTIERKWGGAYLTHAVFAHLRQTMADKILLVMAELDGRIIGGALNFIGTDALYGRNWGADVDLPNLHFEACYYQAIEFAIERGLHRVEAGAQGVHKLQRGYLPVTTYSAHYIANDGFRDAVARFLKAEQRGVTAEKNHLAMTSPFKKVT